MGATFFFIDKSFTKYLGKPNLSSIVIHPTDIHQLLFTRPQKFHCYFSSTV